MVEGGSGICVGEERAREPRPYGWESGIGRDLYGNSIAVTISSVDQSLYIRLMDVFDGRDSEIAPTKAGVRWRIRRAAAGHAGNGSCQVGCLRAGRIHNIGR